MRHLLEVKCLIIPSPIAHDHSPCLPSGRAFSLPTGWYVDFGLPAADRTEPVPQVASTSHVVREPFSTGRASPRQRAPLTRLYHFLTACLSADRPAVPT